MADKQRNRITEAHQNDTLRMLTEDPLYIDDWITDLTYIPDVTEKIIFNYFVFKIQLSLNKRLKKKNV